MELNSNVKVKVDFSSTSFNARTSYINEATRELLALTTEVEGVAVSEKPPDLLDPRTEGSYRTWGTFVAQSRVPLFFLGRFLSIMLQSDKCPLQDLLLGVCLFFLLPLC